MPTNIIIELLGTKMGERNEICQTLSWMNMKATMQLLIRRIKKSL